MYGTATAAERLEIIVTIPTVTVEMWLFSGKVNEFGDYWTIDEIEEGVRRVNKGARLLDKEKPEWVYGVLPEYLDMSQGGLCIIGQSYGDFDGNIGIPFGMNEIDFNAMDKEERERTTVLATEHGFLSDDDEIPYAVLDRVWVFMLVERHNRDGQPVFLRMP